MAVVLDSTAIIAASVAAVGAATVGAATFSMTGGDVASIIKELVPLVSAAGIIFTAWVAWKTKESVKAVDAKATENADKLTQVQMQTDGISQALINRGDDAAAKLLDLTMKSSEAAGKEKARVAQLENPVVAPATVESAAKTGAAEAIEGMAGDIRSVDAKGNIGKVEGFLTGKVGGKGKVVVRGSGGARFTKKKR